MQVDNIEGCEAALKTKNTAGIMADFNTPGGIVHVSAPAAIIIAMLLASAPAECQQRDPLRVLKEKAESRASAGEHVLWPAHHGQLGGRHLSHGCGACPALPQLDHLLLNATCCPYLDAAAMREAQQLGINSWLPISVEVGPVNSMQTQAEKERCVCLPPAGGVLVHALPGCQLRGQAPQW